MVRQIELHNFKSHAETQIDLENLTILTGLNGMGKSSIIQALLLLRQTYQKGLLHKGLNLTGELCNIGTVNDCLYQYGSGEMKINIKTEVLNKWTFKSHPYKLSDTFIPKESRSQTILYRDNYFLFSNGFQYISAYRNGPVREYEKDTLSVELLGQISRRDGRCELVAHFLNFYQNEEINEDVCLNNIDNTLKPQVEAWMRAISPNINISVKPNDDAFKINYSFNRGAGNVKTNDFKATNIGFGVSYVLPIVVASLQACIINNEKYTAYDKFIVIENPEAHIHPKGQAKLMELIALAAKSGVQFLIETHSDHIINGLLVAIKKNMIAANEASVYFVNRDENQHASTLHKLNLSAQGKIKNVPPDFFDQIDKDMKTLMGF